MSLGVKQKKRPGGPGRQPAKDPKAPVLFYIEESIIEANGGVVECRDACKSWLEARAKIQKESPKKYGTRKRP